jgi:hypothetical protein
MYVPDLRSNLLSVGKITDKGSTVIFENNKVYILDKDGKEIMIGQKRNHLYYYPFIKLPHCQWQFFDFFFGVYL